jgi:hypothetical protein
MSKLIIPLQPQQKQCGMEQLVARRAHNPKVVGSSPAPATKQKPQVERFEVFCCFRSLWCGDKTPARVLMEILLSGLLNCFNSFCSREGQWASQLPFIY